MACSVRQLSRVPLWFGHFKYVFECDKDGKKKNITITTTNDNQAKIFAEDKCCGDGDLSGGGGYSGGGGGGGCFAPDTVVLMGDGREKPISEIRAGELVLATLDPEEAPTAVPVQEVHAKAFRSCVHIHFRNGEVLRSSHSQPIFTDAGPVRATSLRSGVDTSRLARQANIVDASAEKNDILVAGSVLEDVTLHSLELPGNYIFFVGTNRSGGLSEKH